MGGRLLVLMCATVLTLAAAGNAAAQEAEDPTSAAVDAPAAAEPTGLVGHVVLALRCPVPLGGDDTSCADRPLPSTLSLRSADGSVELGQFITDDAGAFWIAVDPGVYEVVVSSRAIPITVRPVGMTELTIRVPITPRP